MSHLDASERRMLAGAAALLLVAGLVAIASCRSERTAPPPRERATPMRELVVTAHAYNSTPEQTDARPHETASGDMLRPGMRVIAVSEDLLGMGLRYGDRVSIEGLDGEWVVLDRMADGHARAIDVYMGNDREAAERFGKREVTLRWRPGPKRAPGE